MKDYDSIYQIKQTITMAQRLAKQDTDFKAYVGASPRISETIALIDTILKSQIKLTDKLKTQLTFYRDFLIRKNKALFASMVSELSKLSFYLGIKDDSISATNEPES